MRALETWGLFSGPDFLGARGRRGKRRDGRFWESSAVSIAANLLAEHKADARRRQRASLGRPPPPLRPARDPKGHGVTSLFLSPLSPFYRQLLGWDINCPGEFIDNFDVTEHRRNYPHVQNVNFEKSQVQKNCGGS